MNTEIKKIDLAIPFHLNNEINDAVKEFNIKYDKNDNSFETLMEFVQTYENTRINIEFIGEISVSSIVTLMRLNPEIYVRLVQGTNNIKYIQELKDKGCKFFYDSPFCVENYCELEAIVNLGVSDIYVSGDLCYNLPEVSEYCHDRGVKLRTILNRIPNSAFNAGEDPKSIIYFPQDMSALKQYIDTFEFDCGKPYDWAKFDVYYRTWFVRGHWHGDLQEIILNLKIEYPNDAVMPHFLDYKIDCQRRCAMRKNNTCSKCQQFWELSQTLKSKDVKLTTKGQS